MSIFDHINYVISDRNESERRRKILQGITQKDFEIDRILKPYLLGWLNRIPATKTSYEKLYMIRPPAKDIDYECIFYTYYDSYRDETYTIHQWGNGRLSPWEESLKLHNIWFENSDYTDLLMKWKKENFNC